MFTVSLSLTVNLMNCVCPALWDLDINTCFVRIDPTFIAGVLLTHISSSGCIYSSQTPTFSQGAEAALSLGGPGRENHMRGRTEEVLGRHQQVGRLYSPVRYGSKWNVLLFLYYFNKTEKLKWNVSHLLAKALRNHLMAPTKWMHHNKKRSLNAPCSHLRMVSNMQSWTMILPADGVLVFCGWLHVVAVTISWGPFLPCLTAGLHQLLGRHCNETQTTQCSQHFREITWQLPSPS